jgi:hypothetical protein
MSTVNPVQTNTYVLTTDNNPIVFGAGTIINAIGGDAVFGPSEANSWIVTNHGTVTGKSGFVFDFISAFTNDGKVDATASGGVVLNGGGLFTNNAGGVIRGGSGTSGWAVIEQTTGGGYGSVANTFSNSGLIQGAGGGVELAGSTRVNNNGTIEGGVQGLVMNGGGTLINNGTIHGASQTGVYMGAAGTITDNGSITGGVTAVQFGGAGAHTLTVESGATLNGAVMGSTAAGATNTVNLIGSGTANGGFQHFNTLALSGAGTWVLNGASIFGAATVQTGGLLQVGDAAHPNASVNITGTVSHGGSVQVDAGLLHIQGSIIGGGGAFIAGGTMELGSSTGETVQFTGLTGVLQLDHSQSYTGPISGLGPTGTELDLRDIGFANANEATFSGTAASGVLTVTDGTHVAKLKLLGDYLGATFTAASDGHGGVIVHDPPMAGADGLIQLALAQQGSSFGV